MTREFKRTLAKKDITFTYDGVEYSVPVSVPFAQQVEFIQFAEEHDLKTRDNLSIENSLELLSLVLGEQVFNSLYNAGCTLEELQDISAFIGQERASANEKISEKKVVQRRKV